MISFIDIFQLIFGNYYFAAISHAIQNQYNHNSNGDILRTTDVRNPWLPRQPLELKFPLIILMIVLCYFIQYILQDIIVAKLYSKYMLRKKHVTITTIINSVDNSLGMVTISQ